MMTLFRSHFRDSLQFSQWLCHGIRYLGKGGDGCRYLVGIGGGMCLILTRVQLLNIPDDRVNRSDALFNGLILA